MIQLAIVVEGDTEEEFVSRILADYLIARGIGATPFPLRGNVTVERIASEMALHSSKYDCVTSLVDYYGFAKRNNATINHLERQINSMTNRQMQSRFQRNRPRKRVFAYVQQYEFEGLLFADVSGFQDILEVSSHCLDELVAIRSNVATPEDINDGRETAPSRRIVSLMPNYNKRVHGPLLAERVGLSMIRSECPRFDKWLNSLEALPTL